MSGDGKLTTGEATWTCEEHPVAGTLWYIGLKSDKTVLLQKRNPHVTAILDIAADGTLAGIELIDDMPPPPKP